MTFLCSTNEMTRGEDKRDMLVWILHKHDLADEKQRHDVYVLDRE